MLNSRKTKHQDGALYDSAVRAGQFAERAISNSITPKTPQSRKSMLKTHPYVTITISNENKAN
jgi:hypothetical protein